ncbi:MAG: asparaginase [Actinomycetota bacterium]|nr:asparaginase [Actinomycetota bacterium]
MKEALVVDVVRGGIVESVHVADAAVVDSSGAVIDAVGDALSLAAFRSSAKPLQSGACLELGWVPPRDELLALACGSHNGEPEHVAGVDEILADAGLDETALLCPPALPSAALPDVVAAAGPQRSRYHNCSGKHAAMLATCVVRGWPLPSYRDPAHPLQRAIHETIEHLAGTLLETAVDGCGVVTFAAPLAALARAFGAVAHEEPFRRASAAMRAHPFYVAGTGRLCTALMQNVEGLTVKVGAEGLVCATNGEMSMAVKVRDGSARAAAPFLIEMLRRGGALPDPFPAALESHAEPPVTGGGRIVGYLKIRA